MSEDKLSRAIWACYGYDVDQNDIDPDSGEAAAIERIIAVIAGTEEGLIAEHDRRVTELLEANNREVERRRTAEAERDQWNREARRLSACLIALHEAPETATATALKSVAYDIALNCIDPETARFQIERRSVDA